MCFYQTNPPILSRKTAFINQRYNGLQDKIVLENGGFVFGNEPTGTPSRGRYGATRPTRRGFLRGIERELGSFQGGNEGTGGGAGATAWGIFELLKAFSFSKGCWFRERCFDKSRNPAGSRRMTGLSMTDRRETKMAERAIF